MTANTNDDQNARQVVLLPVVPTSRRLVKGPKKAAERINVTNVDIDENNDNEKIFTNITNEEELDLVAMDDPEVVTENDLLLNETSSLFVSDLKGTLNPTEPVDPFGDTPLVVQSNNSLPVEDDNADHDDDGEDILDIVPSTTFSNITMEFQDDSILSSNKNQTDETLEDLELELQKEEEEAEQEYAEEDAELEAEGYVDGTPPLGNDDAIPMTMMDTLEPQLEPPEQDEEGDDDDDDDDNDDSGGDDDDDNNDDDNDDDEEEEGNDDDNEPEEQGSNKDDDNADTTETLDIDVEKDVEIWKEVEEWNEATEEHDKEWFQEYERTHSIQPAAAPIGSAEKPSGTINVHRPSDENDTDKERLSPPPVPSPFSSPTASTSGDKSISPPIVISDQSSSSQHSLAFYAGVSLVPIMLLFCLGRYVCRPKRPGDTRGEYRAVAARYGDMGYDNTFADAMSDDEDDDFMDGYGDVEDDSWGKAGRRTLELPKFNKERNGGLTLKEMNG